MVELHISELCMINYVSESAILYHKVLSCITMYDIMVHAWFSRGCTWGTSD